MKSLRMDGKVRIAPEAGGAVLKRSSHVVSKVDSGSAYVDLETGKKSARHLSRRVKI